ncbi:MAG: Mth938-like domain-containing protein [Candidatus Bathycorpusculaceae bacterium]
MLTRINEMGFSWIIVDGKKHRHDVVIFPNGEVKRRKGGFLMFGSHTFKRKEFEGLCRDKVDVLVVGTGTDGVATICEEARKFLENLKITLIELPSEEAIKKFNELAENKKKVGAIIHVTC